MHIRDATAADWAAIWPFLRDIVRAGETYTLPRDLDEPAARALWMAPPPCTLVAVDGAAVLGTAKIAPNQEGPGAHVANASFMVDPAHAGKGVGRALGTAVLDRALADGYRAMQFNAVVETNTAPCGCGCRWGSRCWRRCRRRSTTRAWATSACT